MPVVSTPLGASLRLKDSEGGAILSLQSVRPNIDAPAVMAVMEGVEIIRAQRTHGARLTVTTELASEA